MRVHDVDVDCFYQARKSKDPKRQTSPSYPYGILLDGGVQVIVKCRPRRLLADTDYSAVLARHRIQQIDQMPLGASYGKTGYDVYNA